MGITPAIRERMFERGMTTKTRGDHGIGLYLTERYITRAGGTIEVSDNVPRGAVFSLFIPCAQTHSCPVTETEKARDAT